LGAQPQPQGQQPRTGGDGKGAVVPGDDEFCNADDLCENPFVCPRHACTKAGNTFCPPNDFTDAAYCCLPQWVCANTVVGCAEPG
jgi:hypothetical protein